MWTLFTPRKQALRIQKAAKPILFWQLIDGLGYVPLILSLITNITGYHNKTLLILLIILNVFMGYLLYRIAKQKQSYIGFGLAWWSYSTGRDAVKDAKIQNVIRVLITLMVQVSLYIKWGD
ncbi:MAG: hypothetical protein HYW33_00220 [Candidatus Blackburnbacteria bacterium]|nr:hypothetical protein [Candidatus Blackburnbacteria bacterium]